MKKTNLARKLAIVAMTMTLVLSTSPFPTVAQALAQDAARDGEAAVVQDDAEGRDVSVDAEADANTVPGEGADDLNEAPAANEGVAEPEEAATDAAVGASAAAATDDAELAADDAATPAPAARPAETFDASAYVSQLNLTLSSGGVTKTYTASGSGEIDTTPDFPDGLERKASYVANITLDMKSMLDAQGKYPFVAGDKITCRVPDIINVGGTTTGRLRDSTADWDGAHDGVGTYEVVKGADGHNVMTITYDDGYVAEKSGKILSSAVKLSGGFDLTGQTNESFGTTLFFGALNVKTKFSKLEIIRNLSIEKTGTVENRGPGFSSSSPYYPRGGSASLDSEGFLTYTVTVKAGEDNTFKLTNVKVTDLFDDESQAKVDLSSMKLVSVINDSSDTTASAVEIRDGGDNIIGWNIGDLNIGASAMVTFKVKLDKQGVTDAVHAAKTADPESDAIDARTLKNTATVSADDTAPVSDDYSTFVSNYVRVSKSTSNYDYTTQSKHFSITVRAPADNRYTMYDVPIHDYLDSGAWEAAYYEKSGISSMTVRHADGTTETLTPGNFEQINERGDADSRSWYATIPEMRPGDVVSIDSYVTFSDAYWTRPAGGYVVGNPDSTYNQVQVGNVGGGHYANDLNQVRDYATFIVTKTILGKNTPNINSDGTIDWVITGNEAGKTSTPANVAGLVLNDVLGPNQEFTGSPATVTFYNQDGSVAGTDTVALPEGTKSFSYTIPDQYGICGYRISYRARITDWDSYVGPAKRYTNTVNGLTSGTALRPRVAAMDKHFVQQADDWSQWQTSIYSGLENGDTYVDTSRSGIRYMYFTQEDLDGITLKIDGIAVDESLYEIAPVQAGSGDGKYASYQIMFKGKVAVNNGGDEVTPSVDHPLVIGYKAHMVNPGSNSLRDYYNDATLTAGGAVDSDNDYCRRANRSEVVKRVESSGNGYITWRVQANYYGYSGQPDGTCVVTDTLPAGLTYVDSVKLQGQGQIDSVTPVVNDDGTTTLTIHLSGLEHDEVCKAHPEDNNGSKEFHFTIKTKITDPEYLYGSESRDFTYTNSVSLNDRYGNLKQASATATIKHVAMSKTMVYSEVTAPYAQFSIEANQDRLDLNPDGDTVGITDVSSKTLSIDLNSINVVDARTGLPVSFTVDASQMGNNEFTVRVPDNTHVKITYQAQVLGYVGQNVQVDNSAFYEGHRTTNGEGSISKLVAVLNASGQAVSEPMVRLSKRNEAAVALGGATYRLDAYDEAAGQWETVRDGIATTDDNSVKGVKVESLELDKLYRFVETQAPAGYVLDPTPHYFVLFGDTAPTVNYPADVDPDDVFQGPSGSVITAYDQPYTPVRFTKVSDDGVQLAGAQFSVYSVAEDGTVSADVAVDEAGNPATFTTQADAANVVSLAPGAYQLVETSAPEGYEVAAPVNFEVRGDVNRTVLVDGQTVQSGAGDAVNGGVGVTDVSARASLKVTKTWDDCSDFDGARPTSVTVQLFADGVAVDGSTVELSADENWTASFDDLTVMKEGKQVAYSVREIDPETSDPVESGETLSNGYTVTVGATTGSAATAATGGYSVALTNAREPEFTSVNVSKLWDDADNQDGVRPESVTVQLFADGNALDGKTEELSEENGWAASFGDLPAANADGSAIVYTVKEIDPETGELVDFGSAMANGYVPQLTSAAFAGYPAGKDPTAGVVTDGDVDVDPAPGADGAGDAARATDAAAGQAPGTGDADQAPGAGDADQDRRSVSYVITNVRAPETVDVSVSKKWDDGNSASRPTSVTVNLLANDQKFESVVLNADGNWTYTFAGLDKFAAGQEIVYTVEEADVPEGYTATVDGNVANGFTVTNTKPVPPAPSQPKKDMPQTGDNAPVALMRLLSVAGATLVCASVAARLHAARKR